MSAFVRELFVREVKSETADGRWITVNGRAIFIAEGQSVEDAVAKRDGGKVGGTGKTEGTSKGSGKTKTDPIVVSEKPPKHLQTVFEQETRSTTSRGFAYNDRVVFLFKNPEGKWGPASGYLHEMDKGEGATVSTDKGWFRVPKEALRFPKGYRRAPEG